jgi:hypothetical protein
LWRRSKLGLALSRDETAALARFMAAASGDQVAATPQDAAL